MQFEAEWHAVPLGRICCFAGIYIHKYAKNQSQNFTIGFTIDFNHIFSNLRLFSVEKDAPVPTTLPRSSVRQVISFPIFVQMHTFREWSLNALYFWNGFLQHITVFRFKDATFESLKIFHF